MEKPCRTCTDFKTWVKLQQKTFDSGKGDAQKQETTNPTTNVPTVQRNDCPLSRDDLGSKTWAFLHTMAARYPDNPSDEQKSDMKRFMYLFSKFYPCHICAEDFQEQLKDTPPQTDSQKVFSQWLCVVHNEVNKKLGKPEFDCKLVNQRWKDGWLDGSCD
ncbi:PREDICTED: FAD-linked sulfhydryl oxidase ALR [Polistes dominula]|uniref:Sulfhydryl oxidase n=1 Tax=Polistes dominula TaxID=743375 RepID=A0ABM1J2B6_POLDO|nr:PREDICTED: FAD-linked sulfhydryl oxidase ALR [Polistes dominula]